MLFSQGGGRRVRLYRSQYPPYCLHASLTPIFQLCLPTAAEGGKCRRGEKRKPCPRTDVTWRDSVAEADLLRHLRSCSVCAPFFVTIASFRRGSASSKTSWYPSHTIRHQDSKKKRHNRRTTRLFLLLPFSLTRDSQT